jgi:VIT1/CCC1 family predicted Fe2+/Mn2+ transporter
LSRSFPNPAAPRPPDVERLREALQDEIDSAFLYRALAALEGEPARAIYERLAEGEERHGTALCAALERAGTSDVPNSPSARARTLAWIAKRFGAALVLPTLIEGEAAAARGYGPQRGAAESAAAATELRHGRLLEAMAKTSRRGVGGATVARLEGRHGGVGGNALRAAVLGANDGLVSNFSLVMGVAGASAGASRGGDAVLIAGFAGLVAGAISMALGEWLSVQSSRELFARQLAIEAEELAAAPEEEAAELALIYESKGVPKDEAKKLADRLIGSEATALDTLAREELGFDPEDLGGSAWVAAATSFALFAIGAAVPLLPFLLMTGAAAVTTSATASTLALFLLGAAITLFTGRGVLASGSRQVVFGLVAAAVTYGIGSLLGVAIGG